MRYEIEIERIDEEFETIDIVDTLEQARFIAYQVPRETYKSIGINKINEDGRIIDTYIVDIYEESGE
jgi:hypothetical protein